jgi:hypothetical protein
MSNRRPLALDLHLHPKQWLAFETQATEVLFGGAAGGGKSMCMRIAAVVWASAIPDLQIYLFRRSRLDLIKNHMEGPNGFRALLAGWANSGFCSVIEDEVRFWNGSKIYLCHCKDEKDIYRYQGAEIHVLLMDELTHFSATMYRFLRNRVRMVGIDLPPQYAGRFPRIFASANPGNIGHLWVKETFIAGVQPLVSRLMPASEGGMIRQFIPARLEDNPSMMQDDPGYVQRLEGLGSEALVKAMRYGDWDVVDGAFFDCWRNDKHVIAPFTIPLDWLRFRSGDWGSASPTSIGWWAVVQDDFELVDGQTGRRALSVLASVQQGSDRISLSDTSMPGRMGAGEGKSDCWNDTIQPRGSIIRLPRGALIRYREDYIASGPNKGLKLTAEQVADRIIEREANDPKLSYGVLDPSGFKQDGGPSIAERINSKLVKAKLAAFRPADNARVSRIAGHGSGPMSGWDVVRSRMIGTGTAIDPDPMIFWFSTCVNSIRTIPVLQHDIHQPEDVDKNAEDHAADDVRYACLSRPYTKTKLVPEPQKDAYRPPSETIPMDSWKVM